MRSFLKRVFGIQSDEADNPSSVSSEYHFEMVLTAVDILAQFAQEPRALRPPEIPGTIASTRGWTIRLEALEEYCRNVPTESFQALAEQLEQPIEVLTSYVRRGISTFPGLILFCEHTISCLAKRMLLIACASFWTERSMPSKLLSMS